MVCFIKGSVRGRKIDEVMMYAKIVHIAYHKRLSNKTKRAAHRRMNRKSFLLLIAGGIKILYAACA
jgi:hypothetical protein